jgi:DUF4097 and DUF4098 domain-containing protein YvlB
MTGIVRAGTVVLAATVAAGCVVSVDSQGQIVREEKRFSVDGVPELHLTTFDGPIEIQSWDRPEVVVEIEKRGPTREAVDTLLIEVAQRGNRVDLEAKRPRTETFQNFGFNVSTSARLIVSAPQRCDVVARTGDGSIKIGRLNGRLELRTGDGAIRASDVTGDLMLSTGDGSIAVDRAEGRLALETGDGGVNVTGQLSAVKMHTGDGSIVFRVEPGASMGDDWDISTGDGSVSLYLPASFNALLDAHTGDGSIRSDLSVHERSPGDDEESRRTLRGRLGDGGKRLQIRTGDGSITLKER